MFDKTSRLSALQDHLSKKLYELEQLRHRYEVDVEKQLVANKKQNGQMINKSFASLVQEGNQLISLYHPLSENKTSSDNTNLSARHFYRFGLEDFFAEEDRFTSALTDYTRKQFFEGIADLAGAREEASYDLVDVSMAETFLIKGESDAIKLRDKEELQRLQLLYPQTEERYIQSQLNYHSVQAALSVANKQLKMLTDDRLIMKDHELLNESVSLAQCIESARDTCKHAYVTEIKPLLLSLQELHSSKIIKGNYELKIARQEYFLSKQNQVIDKLLEQSARHYLLSLLYNIETKSHREAYHLLVSAKALLENEIKKIKDRIQCIVKNPALTKDLGNRDTISTRDVFVNRLYDAIVPNQKKGEFYRSYEEMCCQVARHTPTKECIEELDGQLQLLVSTVKNVEGMFSKKNVEAKEKIANMMASLEERLSMAEVKVNDVIKEIVTKRKLLSRDSLTSMEHSIFVNFFNDPDRLKRCFTEIQIRSNAVHS